jgi:hypothetical protein
VNSEMNQTDVYRKAIQRTFAKLYSVPAEAIDVVCARGAITVHCAGTIFTRQTSSEDADFVSEDDTITLTDDERRHLAGF